MCTCTQVCSALRAAGARLPIIAMTGNVDPGSVELFKRVGFSGLLAKPFNEVRTRAAVAAERRRHDALKRAGIWRVWMCCAQADVRRLLHHLRAGRSDWWSSQDLGALSSRRAVYRPPPVERASGKGAPSRSEATPLSVHGV